MEQQHKKSAFTLLELIFVIVILGIVASIGSELIARVYESYIMQRAQHRASLKTELTALQIANRLAYAIPGTIIRRVGLAGIPEGIADQMLQDSTGESYTVLQWVGADMDSFSTSATPGWSGFCDLDASLTPNIVTPGSDLSVTASVTGWLSGGALPAQSPALFFPYDLTSYQVASPVAGSALTFTGATIPTHIVEHYKLAWSSYALVITGGDLFLHYNFTPAVSAAIPTGATQVSLLMKDISTFKFRGAGRTIRFKICKEEDIGEGFNVTACKEKAVF